MVIGKIVITTRALRLQVRNSARVALISTRVHSNRIEREAKVAECLEKYGTDPVRLLSLRIHIDPMCEAFYPQLSEHPQRLA